MREPRMLGEGHKKKPKKFVLVIPITDEEIREARKLLGRDNYKKNYLFGRKRHE